MTEEITPVPLTFKEQWEQKKLLKRAKKKAKHTLQSQGFGRREASTAVNKAVTNLAKKTHEKVCWSWQVNTIPLCGIFHIKDLLCLNVS